MMPGVSDSWFWPMFGFHGIFGLALVIAVALIVASLFRRPDRAGADPAVAILAERFAKGDLSSSDYARMKREVLR